MKPIWTQVTTQSRTWNFRKVRERYQRFLLAVSSASTLMTFVWWFLFSVGDILWWWIGPDRSFNYECLSITWEISWLARHASLNRPLHEGIRLRLDKSWKTAKLWLGLTFGILPATSFGRNGFVWNSVLKSPLFLLSTPTGTYYTYIR